jgi:glycosyltransferase involved in cell wall biosynthesis
MPDATIVIPCYNAAAYVEAALRSALDQTCRDIEVIAVDDRSTDATPQILEDWAARDKRLIVLRQAVNGGPSAACNAAYAIARGRWVTVLDSDDLYLPPRIERLVAEAEARGADMIADNLIQQDFDTGRDLGLVLPAVAPGATGGLLIAGSNAATNLSRGIAWVTRGSGGHDSEGCPIKVAALRLTLRDFYRAVQRSDLLDRGNGGTRSAPRFKECCYIVVGDR